MERRYQTERAAFELLTSQHTVANALVCPDALVREIVVLALSATPADDAGETSR